MASLKYGQLNPSATNTKILPVAASQYFYHNGVNAVYLDGSGNVTLALTATATLYGVAIVPTGMGAGTDPLVWKSSATAGADKIPVIPISDDDEFIFPSDGTVVAGDRGNACDLAAVNDGTATYVTRATDSTKVFIIQDLATNRVSNALATDIIVKLNIAKQQAD